MASIIYRHRPYLGTADLESMLNLVAMRPPERLAIYPDSLDLQEITGTPKGRESILLWEDSVGSLAGFTLLEDSSIAFDISPLIPFDDLAKQMVDWAGKLLDSTVASPDAAHALSTGCREEDTWRFSFLERHGFVAQPVRTLHFIRGLDDAIPVPRLPDGFLIRPILGEGEAESGTGPKPQ